MLAIKSDRLRMPPRHEGHFLDFDNYGYHLNASNHPEYFYVADEPIAIVAHNCEMAKTRERSYWSAHSA
jgi:hypothetical protein